MRNMLRRLWNHLFPPKHQDCPCCQCDADMEAYWNELQEHTVSQKSEDDYYYFMDDLNYTASKER